MVLLVVLGRFGWFWVVLGGFGSFWVVPCFSNYRTQLGQVNKILHVDANGSKLKIRELHDLLMTWRMKYNIDKLLCFNKWVR